MHVRSGSRMSLGVVCISLRVGGWGVHSHGHMHTWLFSCASRLIFLGGCVGTDVQVCAHRVTVAALALSSTQRHWAGPEAWGLLVTSHQGTAGSRAGPSAGRVPSGSGM